MSGKITLPSLTIAATGLSLQLSLCGTDSVMAASEYGQFALLSGKSLFV